VNRGIRTSPSYGGTATGNRDYRPKTDQVLINAASSSGQCNTYESIDTTALRPANRYAWPYPITT